VHDPIRQRSTPDMPETWPRTSEDEDDGALEDALRELARAPPVDPEQLMARLQPSRIAPGTRIDDAFVVERLLARGGMGVVYLARQELLQRPVAIKLCRRRATRAQTEQLLKEARAMAALGHPNVVAIHHVGLFDAQVYIAMEYVEGGTLRQWLARRPRTVDEILEAFVAAGQGLAAAHARGFVHRDFKPDNVLVGSDGRVRVGDFGLVSDGQAASLPVGDDEGRTVPGAGTPRYMAPEQHAQRRVTAAADQYAFCESLREALEDAQRRAAAHGQRALRIPRRVQAALQRGLEPEPAARHPSLTALLQVLQPRRRRWSWLAAAVVLASTTAASALTWMASAPDARECPSGRDRMAEAWSPAREQLLRSTLPGDAEVHALLSRGLERFATQWEASFEQTCSDELPTEALREASRGCLGEMLAHFDETLQVLTRPGDTEQPRAMAALFALPVPQRCLDVAAMQRRLQAPGAPDRADEVAALRTELARIRAASVVSGAGVDMARIDAAVAAARALGDRSALAAALFVRARVGAETNEAPHDTVAWLEEAFNEAEAAGDDQLRAEIGAQLVYFIGIAEGRPAEALAWATRTQAVLARLGEAGTAEAGSLEDSVGRVHLANDQLAAATDAMLRAESLKERALGPDHPSTASTRVALGRLLMRTGQHERAHAVLEAAQRGFQAALGPASQDVVHVRLALAELAEERDDDEEALSLLGDVLAQWEATYGPEHPRLVLPLTALGRVASRIGRHDEAIASYARAREIAQQALGPDDVQTGWALVNEASGWLAAGEHERALEGFGGAVAHVHAQAGPVDGLADAALTGRAEALLFAGSVHAALDDARLVLARCAAHACESTVTARAGAVEARGLAALGRDEEAEPRMRRVLAELRDDRRTARTLRAGMQQWLDER
jgi:tetratricopeptide (TPR) repeat protein/predicted Ser/Thr protein kinase